MVHNNTNDKSKSQWVENSGGLIEHSPGNVVIKSIADDKAPPTLKELLKYSLLGVRKFMYKFGYRTSAGTWVISTTDQQLLTIACFIGLGNAAIATGMLSDIAKQYCLVVSFVSAADADSENVGRYPHPPQP
ncbi:hypothetical protein V1504DRAFT_55735 [Lipomyces starkeyi]